MFANAQDVRDLVVLAAVLSQLREVLALLASLLAVIAAAAVLLVVLSAVQRKIEWELLVTFKLAVRDLLDRKKNGPPFNPND